MNKLNKIHKEMMEANPEAKKRMDGLINQVQLRNFLDSAKLIYKDLVDEEGFDKKEVKDYLISQL